MFITLIMFQEQHQHSQYLICKSKGPRTQTGCCSVALPKSQGTHVGQIQDAVNEIKTVQTEHYLLTFTNESIHNDHLKSAGSSA